jgi:hypothetical protein
MEKIILMLFLAVSLVFPTTLSSQNNETLVEDYVFQKENSEMEKLRAREMKAFVARIRNSLNPHTLNYDLQYQRMDVTLDPVVYNISDFVTSHFKAKREYEQYFVMG